MGPASSSTSFQTTTQMTSHASQMMSMPMSSMSSAPLHQSAHPLDHHVPPQSFHGAQQQRLQQSHLAASMPEHPQEHVLAPPHSMYQQPMYPQQHVMFSQQHMPPYSMAPHLQMYHTSTVPSGFVSQMQPASFAQQAVMPQATSLPSPGSMAHLPHQIQMQPTTASMMAAGILPPEAYASQPQQLPPHPTTSLHAHAEAHMQPVAQPLPQHHQQIGASSSLAPTPLGLGAGDRGHVNVQAYEAVQNPLPTTFSALPSAPPGVAKEVSRPPPPAVSPEADFQDKVQALLER